MSALAALVFRHPLRTERAVLYLTQNFLHFLSRLVGDKSSARAVVAVFGSIGYGISHHLKAALVDKVNYEFHLVNTLKICHLRRISSLDQRVETSLHQFCYAAAKYCLLAEKIRLRLFSERRLQDTCSACAYAACICQSIVLCLAGSVLIYCDKRRNTLAFFILASYRVTRSLRSYHDYVDIFRRLDKLEMYVKSVRKHQYLACCHKRLNFCFVYICACLVRNEHHYQIACLCSFFYGRYFKSCVKSLLSMSGTLSQTYYYVHTAFGKVHCMCMALASESDNGNSFAV